MREQPFPDHMGDQMCAVSRSGLETNVLDMSFNRARCDVQFQGRFFSGKAKGYETKHFIFAFCKSDSFRVSGHRSLPLVIKNKLNLPSQKQSV